MESSFNSLKTIGSFAIASFSFLAIPFTTISAEAAEEKIRYNSQSSATKTQIVTNEIEMTEEDNAYLNSIREHYLLD